MSKDCNSNHKYIEIFSNNGAFIALILLFLIASIVTPCFLKPANLINVMRQIAITGIVSLGMTFVIITSGIDLSVGSIVGVVAVCCASLLKVEVSVLWVVLSGIGIGIALGLVNGIGVSIGKLPAFIMTLGTMVAARGLAMIISNGQPVSWNVDALPFETLGGGNIVGIPVPVILFLVLFLISLIVLKNFPFGRYIYAIGDSREAGRLSGINVKLIEISAYVVNGLFCGIAGLVYISRLGVGEPTAGTGIELDAIAMVVIGGTSINGGTGSVTGTFIGAAILSIIANILNLLGISPFIQQVVKGSIIVIAVLVDRINKK